VTTDGELRAIHAASTHVSDRASALATAAGLALILAGGWGIRTAWLSHVQAKPGFAYVEIDPLTSEGQPPLKYLATLPRWSVPTARRSEPRPGA
jgi:hypothetical protein